MKRFEISYNPYSNRIHFRVAIPVDEETVLDWRELPPESSFVEFQNEECIFENNVETILALINNYINTTEYLEIAFRGTAEDFNILQNAVFACPDPKAKNITCIHVDTYLSPNVALERLKRAFSKIEHEFDDYLDSREDDDKEIHDSVISYLETVDTEIPICIVGPNGVGKSSLINAFIGREILPSQSYSTTIINTIVRNAEEYKIEFRYLHEIYEIKLNGTRYSVIRPATPNKEIVSCLFDGCEGCSDEQELLYRVLDKINKATDNNHFVDSIDKCISVYVPFVSSQSNADNHSFCFIDSPITVSGDEDNPAIILEDLVSNQTNAMAIVAVNWQALKSDESLDLRKLLDELGDGFAKSNSIIAVLMSDELGFDQIKEEIPDRVREGIANPTIMYVSPVVALGIKRDDSIGWFDEELKDIYEKNASSLLSVNPTKYNLTPSKRRIVQYEKSRKGRLIYASGISSLESELVYYAKHFADYKKCTQGSKILLDAIDKLVIELKISKAQFETELKNDKDTRRKEQMAFRKKLLDAVRKIETPVVNDVVLPVRKQFLSVLEEYCTGVPEAVRYYWGTVYKRQYTAEDLVKDMQQHCQENLYDKNSTDIINALKNKIMELATDYLDKVESCITKEQESLSLESKANLKVLFENEGYRLRLNDVEIKPFNVVGFNAFKRLGSDERTTSNYSNIFINQLKSNNSRWGEFDKQCIVEPSNCYLDQLNKWINNLIAEIQTAINPNEAILNRFDAKIIELERDIDVLEKRIDNLSKVRTPLLDLIPGDKSL